MRLDHLLSREKAEVETLNAHSEVDTGPRGTVYKEGTHEVPKHVACVLPPVSFSGFVQKVDWDCRGGLAQLGERLPCKQEVSGSIPLISTNMDC